MGKFAILFEAKQSQGHGLHAPATHHEARKILDKHSSTRGGGEVENGTHSLHHHHFVEIKSTARDHLHKDLIDSGFAHQADTSGPDGAHRYIKDKTTVTVNKNSYTSSGHEASVHTSTPKKAVREGADQESEGVNNG